jgi:3-oxoacyl-ACP reductase-like protein
VRPPHALSKRIIMLPTPSKESPSCQVASAVYRRVGGGRSVGLLAAVLSHNHKENVVHPTGQSNEQQPTPLTRRSKMQKELNAASLIDSTTIPRGVKVVKKAALSIVMGMYVVHPIIMLWLFRSPELFSLLGVFQIYHKCSGTLTRRWNACLKHAAMNAFLFFPSLGGIWLWFQSRLSLRRKLLITFSCLLVFKISVDHVFLFRIPSSTNLEGKVAVITGANRGIGFATSVALAELGAHCIVTCRSLSKCQHVVEQIKSKGGTATAAVLDLNSLNSVMLLSKYLSTEFPTVNYFFGNAGTTPQYDLTAEGFENAFGSQYLAHMALGEFIVEFDQLVHAC